MGRSACVPAKQRRDHGRGGKRAGWRVRFSKSGRSPPDGHPRRSDDAARPLIRAQHVLVLAQEPSPANPTALNVPAQLSKERQHAV